MKVQTPTLLAVLREIDALVSERDALAATVEWYAEQARNGNRRRLSDSDVKHIRELHRKGFTQTEIASIYDVNKATVSRIVRHIYHG